MIKVLDRNTINQIAAGEVVERPSSVVKELVENAIDAGSNAITCEISDGGMKIIRITDNGCGICKDEVKTAFLRHATSKIQVAEDLLSISSLGFRGEALASIASVSETEVITKTRTDFTGTRYAVSGGEDVCFEEIGCPEGTTFIVRNLFYNVPARKKFLKSSMTEAGYIGDLMERMAVSHPEISFKYINNNRVQLYTTGNRSLKDIIYSVYGRDITAQLLEADYSTEDGIQITGFIAKPVVSRGNRNYENYYVNGRYIKSPIITRAIEEAYKPYMMQHKYPFTALHILIDGDRLDVNVHPTKMDVRFENGEAVYSAVYNAVRLALSVRSLVQETESAEKKTIKKNSEFPPIPEPFEVRRLSEEKLISTVSDNKIIRNEIPELNNKVTEKETPYRSSESSDKHRNTVNPGKCDKPDEISTTASATETKQAFMDGMKDCHIIGQLFNTYWLAERGNELYIIDQHAAHEKILYEKLISSMHNNSVESQIISPPVIITLNMSEATLVEQNIGLLNNAGFEIEAFGGRDYAVSSIPMELYGVDCGELLLELIASLSELNTKGNSVLMEERLATMACRAAVKGNMKMTELEAEALLEQLLMTENPFHCPHGRPVIISMSKNDIEKKFKRIL